MEVVDTAAGDCGAAGTVAACPTSAAPKKKLIAIPSIATGLAVAPMKLPGSPRLNGHLPASAVDAASPLLAGTAAAATKPARLVLTLDTVLASPQLARHFQSYLVRTHAEENLVFLGQVAEIRAAHAADRLHAGGAMGGAWDVRAAHADARTIVRMFFARASPLELNVPGAMRVRVLRAFRTRSRALAADPAHAALHGPGTSKEKDAVAGAPVNSSDEDDLEVELDALSMISNKTSDRGYRGTSGFGDWMSPVLGSTESIEDDPAVLISTPDKYFAMFDEVQAHVTELLAPRVRGFAIELNRSGDALIRPPSVAQRRVVIIGGGFCGSLVARLLDRSDNLQVCLIDAKPYFEFTAAIVRLIPDPTADTIALPHSSYIRHGQFVLGFVDAVYPDHVLLQGTSGGGESSQQEAGRRIPFDYCVLATGSAYASSIKAANMSSTYRARKLVYDHSRLARAHAVVVIGGGSVGVELAAEIASVFGTPTRDPAKPSEYPRKRVVLVDANSRLLKRLPSRAGERAVAYLREHLGVDVVLNERISHHDARAGMLVGTSGRTFRTDMVYLATGPVPQVACMESQFGHLLITDTSNVGSGRTQGEDKRPPMSQLIVEGNSPSPPLPRRIRVSGTHQLADAPNIFVGGDCAATPVPEEKMALTAQCAAVAIARNIVRLECGKTPIERGHKGLRPFMPCPPVQFISLGRSSALALINNVVFVGPKYLRIKWDELKTRYFDFLTSDSDVIPRSLRMLWGQAPRVSAMRRGGIIPGIALFSAAGASSSASSAHAAAASQGSPSVAETLSHASSLSARMRRMSESSSSQLSGVLPAPSMPAGVVFEYPASASSSGPGAQKAGRRTGGGSALANAKARLGSSSASLAKSTRVAGRPASICSDEGPESSSKGAELDDILGKMGLDENDGPDDH